MNEAGLTEKIIAKMLWFNLQFCIQNLFQRIRAVPSRFRELRTVIGSADSVFSVQLLFFTFTPGCISKRIDTENTNTLKQAIPVYRDKP
ncbi:MAG TPA: hypothetical protein PLK12_05300 [Prolixibacteraceae bacterium]|nr:hypothetical protein [Prolixibacteraceae bacterium]